MGGSDVPPHVPQNGVTKNMELQDLTLLMGAPGSGHCLPELGTLTALLTWPLQSCC